MLATAHQDLRRLFDDVIQRVDCAVICGHRSRSVQDRAFREGKSQVRWPNSRHNTSPSAAVDVVPWPLSWDLGDPAVKATWVEMKAEVEATAERLGIEIEHGADWTSFKDWPHWQLPRRTE